MSLAAYPGAVAGAVVAVVAAMAFGAIQGVIWGPRLTSWWGDR